MILECVCQHCDQRLDPKARSCDRCGAPGAMSVLRAPELEPGYDLYQNAWTGFAVMYPHGWSARSSKGSGVSFFSPEGEAELELSLLGAGLMLTAPQQVELFMRSLPQHQAQLLETDANYARATFGGPQWQGLLSVHLTPQGGTLGIARRRPQTSHDLQALLAKMLSSLSPILPIGRERWVDPNEESFAIDCPIGWQRQGFIKPPQGARTGMRQPTCRLALDPSGSIMLVVDPTYREFIHGPLPAPPLAQEGFFQKLGRYAREAENAMTASMGGVIVPFHGMRPAIDVFFLPHWQREFPGCQMIGYESFGAPDSATVRLLLPGDMIRVYRMVGLPIPSIGMGPPRWLGGHEHFYQAPVKLMEKFEPIFQGAVASFQQLPRWRQREQGIAQAQWQQASMQQQQQDAQWANLNQSLHNQRMNDIAMQGHAAQQAHLNNMAISDMQMQGFQASQRSSDYIQHGAINAVNERSDFINPNTAAVHNLSIHYENYWDTGKDLIVGSNVVLQPPPDWTPLQTWDGRPS